MGIRKVKPTTPGRRGASFDTFSDITSTKPERRLLVIKKRKAGRNNRTSYRRLFSPCNSTEQSPCNFMPRFAE